MPATGRNSRVDIDTGRSAPQSERATSRAQLVSLMRFSRFRHATAPFRPGRDRRNVCRDRYFDGLLDFSSRKKRISLHALMMPIFMHFTPYEPTLSKRWPRLRHAVYRFYIYAALFSIKIERGIVATPHAGASTNTRDFAMPFYCLSRPLVTSATVARAQIFPVPSRAMSPHASSSLHRRKFERLGGAATPEEEIYAPGELQCL